MHKLLAHFRQAGVTTLYLLRILQVHEHAHIELLVKLQRSTFSPGQQL
jgi:hypothetical protein